jgi:hypothetical protein
MVYSREARKGEKSMEVVKKLFLALHQVYDRAALDFQR